MYILFRWRNKELRLRIAFEKIIVKDRDIRDKWVEDVEMDKYKIGDKYSSDIFKIVDIVIYSDDI